MTGADWQVYVTADDFMRLRTDKRLGALMALGRVANALTLVVPAVQRPLDWSVPRVRRERTSALFYTAAMLHEGLHIVQSLGAYFRHLPEYRPLAALQGDPEVIELRRRVLKPLRDKAVFHYDPEVAKLIPTLEATDDVVLVSGQGPEVGATYVDFADTVIVHFILGLQPTSDVSVWAELGRLLDRTAKLLTAFLIGAHTLLPPALRELGVRQRVLPS